MRYNFSMKTRMHKRLLAVSLGIAGILVSHPLSTRADLEVSGSVTIEARTDFDVPLAPLGEWVEIGTYGHCWHPRGVAVTWRPYCDGTWVWTDDGWYWESSEPWAWACYHYGTWVYDPTWGWCWLPDVVWAPAWVEWRTCDDYFGWVPCGPPGFVFEPSFFVFVESRNFCNRVRPSTVIINNTEIINRTTVVRNITRENREINGRTQTVIVNQGPRVDIVEKATGRSFKPTPIQQADRRTFNSIPRVVRQRSLLTQPSHDLQANPVRQPGPNGETHNAQPGHNVTAPPEHNNPSPEHNAPNNNYNPPQQHTPTAPPNNNNSSSGHWWDYHPSHPKSAPQPQPQPGNGNPHPNNPPGGYGGGGGGGGIPGGPPGGGGGGGDQSGHGHGHDNGH